MKRFKIYPIAISISVFCFLHLNLKAQETKIQLPTNDNTSSFNITKNNGTSVLKVEANGRMTGDGSGLSNVRPVAAYAGGDLMLQITANYAVYQNAKQVNINVPGPGNIIVIASGYLRWESTGWDLCLLGILSNLEGDPNISYSAQIKWYKYLNILTDYNCPDSSDQYTSFTNHRGFTVSGAGNYTFTLWVNKYSSSAKVRVDDINISAMYFPTGGTGGDNMQIVTSDKPPNINRKQLIPGSIDGVSPPSKNDGVIVPSNIEQLTNKMVKLEAANGALKERLTEIERLLTEIKEAKTY